MGREKTQYDEPAMLEAWKAWRAEGKGAKAFVRAKIPPSLNIFYACLRRWRANLDINQHPITGEPMMPAEALVEYEKIGRYNPMTMLEAAKQGKLPKLTGVPATLDGTVPVAAAGPMAIASQEKDGLRVLKLQARDLLQKSLKKAVDPAQIQSAKAILGIKEAADDKIPNPYAGLAIEELVDRLLTTCISMVGVKSVYKRVEFLNMRGEAEVVGEVSGFKPASAETAQ